MKPCSTPWPMPVIANPRNIRSLGWPTSFWTTLIRSFRVPMSQEQIVNPAQKSAYESPWPARERFLRVLWEFCWLVFCVWTPKPLNEWRLFWLRVFDAKIDGKPFVHQRARIAVPWNLILHDRACLGDRANAYSLGEIEIGAGATIAQEAYLSSASHDCNRPAIALGTT